MGVDTTYQEQAKNILKGEIKRRGLTYGKLAELLASEGIAESERNLANKISRGTFTAAFFLQCLSVVGCETLRLKE